MPFATCLCHWSSPWSDEPILHSSRARSYELSLWRSIIILLFIYLFVVVIIIIFIIIIIIITIIIIIIIIIIRTTTTSTAASSTIPYFFRLYSLQYWTLSSWYMEVVQPGTPRVSDAVMLKMDQNAGEQNTCRILSFSFSMNCFAAGLCCHRPPSKDRRGAGCTKRLNFSLHMAWNWERKRYGACISQCEVLTFSKSRIN